MPYNHQHVNVLQFLKVYELHSPVMLHKFGTVFNQTLLMLWSQAQLLASNFIWRRIYTDNRFPNNDLLRNNDYSAHTIWTQQLDTLARNKFVYLLTYSVLLTKLATGFLPLPDTNKCCPYIKAICPRSTTQHDCLGFRDGYRNLATPNIFFIFSFYPVVWL